MSKSIDFDLGGVGDIDIVLHNQGVSDLSWLSVDEEAYRASEALPKQNLDIVADLQKALTYSENEDVAHVVPMRPYTMVVSNPLDTHIVPKAELVKKTARYVMQGLNPVLIKEKLSLEFDPVSLRTASSAINDVVKESGLLGNVYVDSNHFDKCHNLSETDRKFVATSAKKSLFVIANSKCGGCVCNKAGACSSFKKSIVSSVPYGSKLASKYVGELDSTNRLASLSGDGDWKTRLQNAFLTKSAAKSESGPQKIATQQIAPKKVFTEDQEKLALQAVPEATSSVDPYYAKFATRMMLGKDDRHLLIASGNPILAGLSKEYGILGYNYIDSDALGGCKKTVGFLKSNPHISPIFIVRRASRCSVCLNHSDGACAQLSKCATVVNTAPVVDRSMFELSAQRAIEEGRISQSMAQNAIRNASSNADWVSLVSDLNQYKPVQAAGKYTQSSQKQYTGGSVQKFSEVDPENIRRDISHLMNTGMRGSVLVSTITNKYAKTDLVQLTSMGKRIASMDGIQGSYFIDPTAYADYGSGCSEGASHFRKKGAQNVLASHSCNGCTLQTSPGWCSKYAKTMIRSIPNELVETHLANVASSQYVERLPVTNPVADFELSSSLDVDVRGSKDRGIDISFSLPTFGD